MYITRHYCFEKVTENSSTFKPARILIVVLVLLSFPLLSFAPFLFSSKLFSVIEKLFASQNKIFSYKAPNFWILYEFLENAISNGINSLILVFGNGNSWLESPESFFYLPQLSSSAINTTICIILIPVFWKLWKQNTPRAFHWCIVLCGLTAFIFGIYDDRNSILIAFVPFWLILDLNTRNRVLSVVFYLSSQATLISVKDEFKGSFHFHFQKALLKH